VEGCGSEGGGYFRGRRVWWGSVWSGCLFLFCRSRKRNVLDVSLVSCAASCGELEDMDHLFFKCNHYGHLWLLISHWLGIDTVYHGDLNIHSNQFCVLKGFSKNSRTTFTIIWISVLIVI